MIKVLELELKIAELEKRINHIELMKNPTVHDIEYRKHLERLHRSYNAELEKAKDRTPVDEEDIIQGFNYRDWRYI